VFSTITYSAAIVSLIGSVCFTQPVVKSTPTVELVYKVGTVPTTEYYKPVFIENDTSSEPETKQQTFKPVLLTDVYQVN